MSADGCRRARACAALAGLAVWFFACGGGQRQDPRVITIALVSSPNNLDPRVGTDEVSQRLHQLIFDPLFTVDGNLQVTPHLATGLETPDPRTYVVRLRHAVRFHDGHELTAADVVYTFQSFIDPAFVSGRKGAYRMLASVRARDAYTVEFVLKEPFGSFPVNLVMGIVPDGWRKKNASEPPVGTGPYRFLRELTDDRVDLAAFGGYFLGAPRNAGLVLKIVPDDVMRGLELRKGTVDLVVNDLAPDIVQQLRADARLQVVTSPGTDYAYLGFNLRDPVLRDVRVRRAIGYAVDRKGIVEYLRRGLATPAIGILPPMCWAFDPDVFSFTFDPGRAETLLDEAGYPDPDGRSGPRTRNTLSLKVSSTEFNRLQSAVIQQDLRRVGIDLDVRTYEFSTLYADVLRGNFQMFTLQWVGVSDPDMLRRVFHSRQVPPAGFNRGFFSSPVVDDLLDRATVSTNEGERRELYGEAQRVIAEQVPYVSLWYKVNVAVAQRSLSGLRLSPSADFMFLRNVERVAQAPDGMHGSAMSRRTTGGPAEDRDEIQ